MNGLVHIYTGNGKGKTTAALGLGIRAYGRGFRVLLVQFLKGVETGELVVLEKLSPGFEVRRSHDMKKFVNDMDEAEVCAAKTAVLDLWNFAVAAADNHERDLIIFDEVLAALTTGLLPLEEVLNFLKNKSAALEVVLTGRNAPRELIELADYVSEISAVKHPYEKGIPARKGIEY